MSNKTYFVTISCEETIVIQAKSEKEAEAKALEIFDATALDADVLDVWTDDE